MVFGSHRSGQKCVQVNSSNQFKEVTDFKRNVQDVMGRNWRYWFMPCAPRHPKDPDGYD